MIYSFNKKTIALVLVLLSLFGCESKEKAQKLDPAKAKEIISGYIKDPHYNVRVSADVFEKSSRQVNVVGKYNNWIIAIDYDRNTTLGESPRVSPDIDYYLSVNADTPASLRKAMETLKNTQFTPVVSKVHVPKELVQGNDLDVLLEVRHSSGGDCSFTDQKGNFKNFALLQHANNKTFSLEGNAGSKLKKGDYTFKCIFTNNEQKHPDSDTLPLASFTVKQADHPLHYIGGLKSRSCILGQPLKLEADFGLKKEDSVSIVYYSDGEPINGDTFICENIGKHKVHAVATDSVSGQQASSSTIEIQVDDLPDILKEFQGSEHVSF